ncbi:phosphatase PAP2 family protein [Mesorhizobium sp. AR07]|uniref:phosphatase PAP2 family protein n=1 Tax=Mesorhizobium sp. AR07 TaxID=2865838 RepID=UPI0039B6F022
MARSLSDTKSRSPHQASFPSDHATASFAIVFSYVFNARVSKALWFFAAALLLVISRVYVGTHYVGDILGGYRDRAYCRRAGPDSLSGGHSHRSMGDRNSVNECQRNSQCHGKGRGSKLRRRTNVARLLFTKPV